LAVRATQRACACACALAGACASAGARTARVSEGVVQQMDFAAALGLDAPLEALGVSPTPARVHDPRTCRLAGCACRPRIQITRTPAGTPRMPPADADAAPLILAAQGAAAAQDAAAQAAAARIVALRAREAATRIAVLAVYATSATATGTVIQACLKCYDENGKGVMGYDRLWGIDEGTKISLKAYKEHKIDYKTLRAWGLPAKAELATLAGMLRRLVERDVRIVSHDAKTTLRLLAQTAVQQGLPERWCEPFPIRCLGTKARRNMNSTDSANPNVLSTPTEHELYRHLCKRAWVENGNDLPGLARACGVTAQNYVAGQRRGWW